MAWVLEGVADSLPEATVKASEDSWRLIWAAVMPCLVRGPTGPTLYGSCEGSRRTASRLSSPRAYDLGPVQLALGTLRDAAGRGDGLAASNAHRGFHLALVGLAGSRQLLATYEPVIVKLRLYMAANLRREAVAGSPAEGVRRHQRLLDAVLSRDPVRIGEELDRHGSRQYFH
ncbi:MAG: FCD domain-containing protein [Dermatophilaceae bacterium]